MAGEGPTVVQQFEGFHQLGRGVHQGHSATGEKGGICLAVPGERCRVGGRNQCAGLGLARLHCNDPLATGVGRVCEVGEAAGVADRLDVQPDCRHPFIGDELLDHVLGARHGLIAHGDQVGERKSAIGECDVQPDVATLRHDAHAAIEWCAAVLIGPQRHTIESVDVAVTVRPEKGHVAGRFDELTLQFLLTALGESRGVTDCSPRTDGGEAAHCIHGEVPVDGDEGHVGNSWQVANRGDAGHAMHLAASGVHGPKFSRESEFLALFDHA